MLIVKKKKQAVEKYPAFNAYMRNDLSFYLKVEKNNKINSKQAEGRNNKLEVLANAVRHMS